MLVVEGWQSWGGASTLYSHPLCLMHYCLVAAGTAAPVRGADELVGAGCALLLVGRGVGSAHLLGAVGAGLVMAACN